MIIEDITVHSAEYLENGDIKLILHDPEADAPGETSIFIASPDDVVETGRELFQKAVFEEFGPVEPFVPTPPNTDPDPET